jgi:hypothetical protein
MVVFVADQHALTRPAHAMRRVVLLQPLKPREHRGILFWLAIFGAECVVAEGVQPDCLRLVRIEVLGECGPARVRIAQVTYIKLHTGRSSVKLAA